MKKFNAKPDPDTMLTTALALYGCHGLTLVIGILGACGIIQARPAHIILYLIASLVTWALGRSFVASVSKMDAKKPERLTWWHKIYGLH